MRIRLSIAIFIVAAMFAFVGGGTAAPPPGATMPAAAPAAASGKTAEAARAQLDDRFTHAVYPFLQTYCVSCHSGDKPKADLDLTPYTTADTVAKDAIRWEIVLERVKAKEMPPAKATTLPSAEARDGFVDWVQALRKHEADQASGDPGPVLARRLSNAEYNNTIRDLTGVDIQPAKEFPVDPANEMGFDNSGESLSMSPSLIKKYLEAARLVASHLVLKPQGIAFAAWPMSNDTDRDKYCVNRIVEFYYRQPTDFADYFAAAWMYEHRAELGQPKATLADIAAQTKVSPRYLTTVWTALAETPDTVGPVAALQAMWRSLPKPVDGRQPAAVMEQCEQMRDLVAKLRQRVAVVVNNLSIPNFAAGSQTTILWKDRQMAMNRMTYAGNAASLKSDDLWPGTAGAAALNAPTTQPVKDQYEASFKRFCEVFPDAFYVSERGRTYADQQKEAKAGRTGRLLSAGFHSQMGYFRDDTPLVELILNPAEQKELDALWTELDFVASACIRQHRNFLWFERTDSSFIRDAQFDPYRPEDADSTTEEKIKGLSVVYLEKIKRFTSNPIAIKAVEDYFINASANIRRIEKMRIESEPSHVAALQDFAARAFRRPLTSGEKDSIAAFYKSLREKSGLEHEEACRDTLASILMSPNFCYLTAQPGPGSEPKPLSDYELASRLSYMLWASTPDDELLAHAAAGNLHQREVLLAQARRMIHDPRVRGFATEFGGNWLDFRRFEEHNAVDRERFKTFDNELREAMFEEPIRFIVELAQRDRSVFEFIDGDYTFVNGPLARHYGMPTVAGGAGEWVRIDHARQYERGGLLPMAVFLTKNAPGLRTSPVKRGYWVDRKLLGEVIPPPPADVPVLPNDEAKLELSLRATMERHRADPGCAACHARFDAMGLVFENFGPIGELRMKDFGGRDVDTHANFPDGVERLGVDGLRQYILTARRDDYLNNFCRKLLCYSIGRSLMLSDDPTVQQMRAKLDANGNRFSSLIEAIVTSPQFLTKRGRDFGQMQAMAAPESVSASTIDAVSVTSTATTRRSE